MHTNDHRLEAAEKRVPRMSFPMGTGPNMTILIDDMSCLAAWSSVILTTATTMGGMSSVTVMRCLCTSSIMVARSKRRMTMMAASTRRLHITRADVGGPKATMASVRIQGGDGPQLVINLALELHRNATNVLSEVEEAEVHDQMTYLSMV
jgi:hypothetical protein